MIYDSIIFFRRCCSFLGVFTLQRTPNPKGPFSMTFPSLYVHDPILHLLFKRSAIPFPGVCKYKRHQMSFLPLAVRWERKTCLQAIRICHRAHRTFLQLSDANQMVSRRDKLLFLDSGWLLAVDDHLLEKGENPNPTPVLELNFLSQPCALRRAEPAHPQKR